MTFFRSFVFVFPAACLLAQTPPPNSTPVRPPTMSSPLSPVAPAPAVPPDKVVITVGDTKITAAQFDQIVGALPAQYQASARGPGKQQFADNLVRILVLSDEGKRRKLDETSTFKLQNMFQTANLLAGLTFDQISKDLKVDDAATHKFYEEHKAEFEQVRARHILIRFQGSPLPLKAGQKDLTDAEALAKAQELRKKIEGGADFAEVAKTESDDSGSGANGGDLNFFKKGQMVPAFEEAAWALKAGELSQPVKSPFGYHLIKVEVHESKSFDEVKPELEKRMRPELAQKALEDMQKKSGAMMDPVFFAPAPAQLPPPAMLPAPAGK